MSEMFIKRESLVAVADAIRESTGETKLYSLDEMYEKLCPDFIYVLTKDNYAIQSLPDGITKIRDNMFYGNKYTASALTSLPDSLISIGEHAFSSSCVALTSLPKNLTIIDNYAFFFCSGLAITSIPASVTNIRGSAFYGCGLTELTFEGTPEDIAIDAFSYCNKLTTINVPWSEGEVADAPWGADNATINYNYGREGA